MSIREMVEEFHRVGGHPVVEHPTVLPRARLELRIRCIAEEVRELLTACGFAASVVEDLRQRFNVAIALRIADPKAEVDLVAVADALADIDYFVEGTRLEFGIDGQPVAQEVHRSNMQKFECEACSGSGDGDERQDCEACSGSGQAVRRREDGKILKPRHWTPPDIVRVLQEQGMIERLGVPR